MTRIETLEQIVERIGQTLPLCATNEERWDAEADLDLADSAIESDDRAFQVSTIRHLVGYLLTD